MIFYVSKCTFLYLLGMKKTPQTSILHNVLRGLTYDMINRFGNDIPM